MDLLNWKIPCFERWPTSSSYRLCGILHRVGRLGADDSDAVVEEGRVDAGYVDLGHVAGYAILGRYGARLAGVIARCGMWKRCAR
jgi:hypothetical protein